MDEFLEKLDERIQSAENRQKEIRVQIDDTFKRLELVDFRIHILKEARDDYIWARDKGKEEDKK